MNGAVVTANIAFLFFNVITWTLLQPKPEPEALTSYTGQTLAEWRSDYVRNTYQTVCTQGLAAPKVTGSYTHCVMKPADQAQDGYTPPLCEPEEQK